MDALHLVARPAANNKSGQITVSVPGLCIGCGVCAYKCPTGSLSLKTRPQVIEPPMDVNDLKRKYAQELAAARNVRGETVSDEPRFADVSSGDSTGPPDGNQGAGAGKSE